MIPKKIHYCWFGRGEKPALVKKCMASWKKYLPEYELKEWNEDNFDLDLFPFTREAYESRKYAFVTVVVRLYALYNEGGVYMDTDVEVLKPLDSFLHHIAFSGFEDDTQVPTGIMASEKNSSWAKENLDYYHERHFILPDGTWDTTSNVAIITNYMVSKGLLKVNGYYDFPNLITIYPKDYFCPKSYLDKKIYLTDNTVTIHHFSGSWQYKSKVRKFADLLIGEAFAEKLRLLYCKILKFLN